MKPRRRVEWTHEQRDALEALLRQANGRRTTRLLTLPDLERCMESALRSELGFAWASAGDAPDARAVTSICLAVISGEQLTVGVAPAHGAATPASGWADLAAWDRYREQANAAACRAWAGRPRPDRVVVPLLTPEVPSTASREALLAAVLAHPEDDAPRLVYADWLSDRGDPRGEFISIQCALAVGTSRVAELQAQEASLLASYARQWLHGLGDDVLRARFRRGFVETATVLDANALFELEAFFEREPVTELVFASSKLIDTERFASLEWVERLRSLEFRGPGALGRDRLATLLASRRLRQLTSLAFLDQRLGDEGLRLLAEQGGKTFPALERLRLEDDAITERGVAPLVASRWAARFTELSLADNQLGPEGAEVLAEARSPGRLTRLSLGGNQLRDEGAMVIARAARFRTLRELSLPRNRIGPAGVEALLESEGLAGLTSLDLAGNPVGSSGRKRLQARFER